MIDESGNTVRSTDYYPFGAYLAESTNREKQPYKYNGKEFDHFADLNLYDYGARFYDPLIGRFTTPDPLSEKYYSISPYAYCANNPVNAVDLRGDSITTVINSTITNPDGTTSIQSDRYYYGQDADGNYGFMGVSGQIYAGDNQFVNSLSVALENLRGGAVGQDLVNNLMGSANVLNIVLSGRNAADAEGAYITWNPNSLTGGMNVLGNENRPAYIGLGHEMAHIQDTWAGTIDNSTWVTVNGISIPNSEKYATHIENQLRVENNVPLRTHYGIDASTGTRVGLESTRIITGVGNSRFYNQSNGSVRGIPLLPTPFRYR